MIIKGDLITCKRQVKEFKGKETKEKLFITVADVKLNKEKETELKNAFKDAGKNFTPDWIKNFKGYVNVSTEFELPCRDLQGEEHDSIEKFIQEDKFPYMGAEVKLSLNVKEGAIYPNSIMFLSEGKPYNPFAEFDNDDED